MFLVVVILVSMVWLLCASGGADLSNQVSQRRVNHATIVLITASVCATIVRITASVCVFITAGPIIKLCAGREGDSEGHVL